MKSFFKVWTAILISICALNVISVEGIGPSSMSEQSSAISTQDPLVSAQLTQIHGSDQEHSGDCGDRRHPGHHQCHVGHCAFTSSSSLSSDHINGSSSFLPFSRSSLVGVDLSGPRKPPRA